MNPADATSGAPIDDPRAALSGYVDDAPISRPEDDKFGRWPFSERIARVLATRSDSSSIAIGLYGPWGDGKTSVLNMMARALEAHGDVVCVRFNPWYFDEPGDLVRSLFDTLADVLDTAPAPESVGTLLRRYGAMLSSSWKAEEADVAGAAPAAGRAQTRSTTAIEDLKGRVSRALIESNRRTVVLVDDVDRLEASGVQTLLRLVNLSASLATVSYILAIDAAVVEAALGHRYGGGNPEAGRQFLEKIIQVPLHLPDAENVDLQSACLAGIDAAIRENRVPFPASVEDEFLRHFLRGLVPGLRTPRQVKRYVNAIRFSVPMLRGEVHILDQLLVEGVRVVYPRVYLGIRNHPETFTGRYLRVSEIDAAGRAAAVNVVDACLSDLQGEERVGALYLLKVLFPRLNSIFGKTAYGTQWDRTWEAERRIASWDYFRRYFQYSVPVRDIGDGAVARLVAASNDRDDTGIDEFFQRVSERGAWAAAVRKIRMQASSLTAVGSGALARGLSRAAAAISAHDGGLTAIASPVRQAAILTATLLDAGTPATSRATVAKGLFDASANLRFSAGLFAELTRDDPGADGQPGSGVDRRALGEALASRVAETLARQPMLRGYGADLERLLAIWMEFGPPGAVPAFLAERFRAAPRSVIDVLQAFCQTPGVGGRPATVDLDDDRYRAAARFVDTGEVADILEREFATVQKDMTLQQTYEQAGDARLAGRFIVLHRMLTIRAASATG